ncbi:MAG: hypothetical protein GQ522_03100 [Deltaproteobacteria bacterium]|nr:hypothetical protein [Deltaproteobacteria bacterium]
MCKERECFDKVVRRGREVLAGGFRCRVEISDRERLWSDFVEIAGENSPC